jgi:molecular chaperone GrpE
MTRRAVSARPYVLDNFELAKANIKTVNEGEEKISTGYHKIFENLTGVLETQGMKVVDGVGSQFDPNVHEAIMREESSTAEEAGSGGCCSPRHSTHFEPSPLVLHGTL